MANENQNITVSVSERTPHLSVIDRIPPATPSIFRRMKAYHIYVFRFRDGECLEFERHHELDEFGKCKATWRRGELNTPRIPERVRNAINAHMGAFPEQLRIL